jgi:hypothetical protein
VRSNKEKQQKNSRMKGMEELMGETSRICGMNGRAEQQQKGMDGPEALL